MAADKPQENQNPLQALVGGILGLPGQILEKTGLDQAGEMLVDSLQPDGTISVSHLLDLGGVRSAKKRQRDIASQISELQLEGQQVQLDAAKRKSQMDEINAALGFTTLAPEQKATAARVGGDIAAKRAGVPAAQEKLAQGPTGPGTMQKQEALKAGIAAGEAARADFLKRNALDAQAMADAAQARANLNARLKLHGVKDPEAQTAQMSTTQMGELDTELLKAGIANQQAIDRAHQAHLDRIDLAKKKAKDKVYTPGKIGLNFQDTIGANAEDVLGIYTYDEKGKRVPVRSASQQDMMAIAAAKDTARAVYQATKDSALANAVAQSVAMDRAGLGRFDLSPRNTPGREFEFPGRWWGTSKAAGGKDAKAPTNQGLTKEHLDGLVERITEHKLRNNIILQSGLKSTTGEPIGLPVGSTRYLAEWAKALDQIPGVTATVVENPLVPGTMKIDIPMDKLDSDRILKSQVELLVRAILAPL